MQNQATKKKYDNLSFVRINHGLAHAAFEMYSCNFTHKKQNTHSHTHTKAVHFIITNHPAYTVTIPFPPASWTFPRSSTHSGTREQSESNRHDFSSQIAHNDVHSRKLSRVTDCFFQRTGGSSPLPTTEPPQHHGASAIAHSNSRRTSVFFKEH